MNGPPALRAARPLPPFGRSLPPFMRSLPLVAAALLVLALIAVPALRGLVATRVRTMAAARGLTARWDRLDVALPAHARFARLIVTHTASGDTVFAAESLAVAADPWALLTLRARVASVSLAHAQVRLARSSQADTLLDEPPPRAGDRHADPARSAHMRESALQFVRLLVAPARRLPRMTLRDVTIRAGGDDADWRGARIEWLELAPARGGVKLEAAGWITGDRDVTFETSLVYANDDRLRGGARFGVPTPDGTVEPLHIAVDGALHQDRRAQRVTVAPGTRVTVGRLAFTITGEIGGPGPAVHLALAADSLTADAWKASLPSPVLGPLRDLNVRGWYGYRVSLDLDVSMPDSVNFDADVIPHGLTLGPSGPSLDLTSLDQPFLAMIHLPRGRFAQRDLSPANPHFLPIEAMDSILVHAVVTNEDGAFFRHHGFNTDAVKDAIAENIKAGAYRRGAGTITMQLARNLFLGHDRTLSRKGQEVVLAWVLEHLTNLSKQRLLEIYLNIIEWGPGVHGADEAAEYYFGHPARRMTVDEALFLTTVIPAPSKWRYRLDATGTLRPFEREQMHFIGRAMVAKGWLSPEDLPPLESLRIELRGPARDELPPMGAARADSIPA